MRHRFIRRPMLLIVAIGIAITLLLTSTFALFSGGHTLYENRTDAVSFCSKCHPDKAAIINVGSNAHRNAGCACHGYNPNTTYDINSAHNLTKNIYCTDCHTNYSITTGNITIHGGGIVANNQSAHYLINSSEKSAIYQRAVEFFNNSRR